MAITFVHSGIEVEINEKTGMCHFELCGRCRTADTPEKAREFIDNKQKQKGKANMPSPITAIFSPRYRGGKSIVQIKSIADGRGGLWIVSEGHRQKESREDIFADIEKNHQIFHEIECLIAASDKATKKAGELRKQLVLADLSSFDLED